MGEAWELGQRYTCSDELAPLRDKSAKRVSRRLRKLAHTLVEEKALVQEERAQPKEPVEPEAPAQVTEQVAIDITNLSDTEFDRSGDMVTRKTMTIDHFVPSARQNAQQQPPQGGGQTPPSPPPHLLPRPNEPERGNVLPSILLPVWEMS